uniref:Uncharacterized protein n=1 Tax=Alexandrium catenella TaxID=2925 RepID=A0A7S1QUK9_ALECA
MSDTRRPAGLLQRNTLDGTSVTGLRDRLLREARSERARCLEVAEAAERRRAELRGVTHVATQTDPVVIVDGSTQSSSIPTTVVGVPAAADLGPSDTGAIPGWSQHDEAAQAEAMRTIQLLGQRGSQSRFSESRAGELEAELRAERAGRQELDAQVAHERSRKEAAQQQVLCLEYELDGKEAALQVAERALERRDADLQQAQLQLRALQEGAAAQSTLAASNSEEARVKALKSQLMERERQLELKDQHISRLLNVLRQHRSTFVEEDSTICGSERSMTNFTMTTSATR